MANIDKTYLQILEELKQKIKTAQVKAALSVNSQMVILYWEIGKTILDRQEKEGWGTKVVQNLAKDLQTSFPEMKGLSDRNLKYMRKFAETYADFEFVQQAVALLPWGHNIVLLDKVNSAEQRIWYAKKAIENGWSRNIMAMQIESDLYKRQALSDNKTTNFLTTLPPEQSELVQEIVKDPYNFDFLTLTEKAQEKDVEEALMKNLTSFLLELGKGFAFVGQQYHLEVGEQDYYLDLLFYNTKLHCYVVFELKIGEFKPEYAGKVNFYLTAVDNQLKTEYDQPSIGIILCKSKNKIIAEYSLRDITKPIGISEYTITQVLSEELKTTLPTIEELEKELQDASSSL
jgi:predicted nuclease of restriction endonuclease-like (RecB) superfamily